MVTISGEQIGFWNTGVPIIILVALALLLPGLLARRNTRSQREVAVAIWASAGLLLIAGAAVIWVVYSVRGIGVSEALGDSTGATIRFFLRQSGFAAIVWVPILAIRWFGMAQAVEKRKGEDVARDE